MPTLSRKICFEPIVLDFSDENDVSALDMLIQYPLAYIGAGSTILVGTYPVQPADLMAAKQWHDTEDLDPEVVFVTQDKAHVIVRRATRCGPMGHRSRLSPPSMPLPGRRPVGGFSPFLTSPFRSVRSEVAIEIMLGCCLPSRISDSR